MSRSDVELPFKTLKWKSLLGFFSEQDALNFIKSLAVPLSEANMQELSDRIREAIKHVSSLTGRNKIIPEICPISVGGFREREQKLRIEPTFSEHAIGMKELTFGMVEIKKCRAFQPNINLDYTQTLKAKVPEIGDEQGLLKFCLPTRDEMLRTPAVANFNPTTNTFTLVTENLDTRILGQVQGEDPATGRHFFGFAYGGGLPQMSVVEYKGIYMIKNGYHRAYALMEKGHELMPCLVLKTDNYQTTGAVGPGFFNFDLMLSDKSPVLGDFLTKAAVTYPRRPLRLTVSIHGEIQPISV